MSHAAVAAPRARPLPALGFLVALLALAALVGDAGEARLVLGVTLALRAAAESDEARARGLRLRTISRFASVPMNDPCHDAALYDRVLLLTRVERVEEAKRWARAYLEHDPGSPWAMVLIRELPGVRE